MAITTYGDISPRTAGFAAKKLLERGQFLMVTERFGQVDPQGKKKTKTRKYRRYESLARADAPLAEGVSPAGQQLTFTDVIATLEQYGDSVKLTDVIQDTHEDDVLMESMELAGEQAAETIEVLRINVLKGGSNVAYANGVTSRAAVASPATRGDLRLIYRSFRKNKARQISKVVKASAMVSTEPVAAAYFMMGSTDCDADLRGLTGFVPAEQYSNSGMMFEGEIGKMENVRVILTALFEPWLSAATSAAGQSTYLTNGTTGTGSADVYPLITVARDGYAIVPLQGTNAVTPMVLNPGTPSKSDQLGQVGFVSWKTWQTAAILNQNWVNRLEVAATQSPS